MKKITFVQKDDETSYDPVSTFFSKKIPSQSSKSANNCKKQSYSITKTPVEKNNQVKKQQKIRKQQAEESVSRKIGQRGSGYMGKKIPCVNSITYDNVKQQTIYNFKEKQKERPVKKDEISHQNLQIKKKKYAQQKLDMIFDVLKETNTTKTGFNPNQPKDITESDQQIQPLQTQDKTQPLEIKSPNQNCINHHQLQEFSETKNQNISTKPKSKPRTQSQFKQKGEESIPNQNQIKQQTKIKMICKPQVQDESLQFQKQNKEKAGKNRFQQRINQLESYSKQCLSKIQHLELKIEALTKVEQKYNKLLKEHKLCNQTLKQQTQIADELSSAKQSIARFMSQSATPYSKKREYLLLNQINQLKRTNRQLVLRIKNYKGTDLVQMAISKNKEQISREFQVQYKEEHNKLNAQMESQLSIFIANVYKYLEVKSGTDKKAKQQMSFQREHTFLVELTELAQKMSLTYLEKYELSPLPKCNQNCLNLYGQIQKEKQAILKNSQNSIISKEDLNFAITQNNLQILNDIKQNNQQIQQLQNLIWTKLKPDPKQKRPSTSQGNSSKLTGKNVSRKLTFLLQILKKRNFLSTAFHVQSICYFTYLKQNLQIKLQKLQTELISLSGRLKQMKYIYDLGEKSAKQSLYLYLQANLQNFSFIVPNLEFKIKQIKSFYQEISQGLNRKIQTKLP